MLLRTADERLLSANAACTQAHRARRPGVAAARQVGSRISVSPDREEFSAWYASSALHWPANVANIAEKQAVAERIALRVSDGALIGIGSGSATYMALWAIGQRVRRESLAIRIVTTSYETETAAHTLGIPTAPLGSVEPEWGVDGADEVDSHGRVLKGRGGAMFMEKILWLTCRRMYLAIDSSKRVERLGQGFPIPIEVHRHAVSWWGVRSTPAAAHAGVRAGRREGRRS